MRSDDSIMEQNIVNEAALAGHPKAWMRLGAYAVFRDRFL